MSLLKSSTLLIIIIFVQVNLNYNPILSTPLTDISQGSHIESNPEIFPNNIEADLDSKSSQNQIIDLNFNSKINSTINLDGEDPYIIAPSLYERIMEIEDPKALRNLFDFSSVLIPNISKNGMGDLTFQALENNSKLKLSINASTYSTYSSTLLDIPISGTEYFELQLDQIDFNFNTGDFAFANLVFEFNTFNLLVVFENSESYIDFGFHQNSTDSIKILNSLMESTKINISDIVGSHNLDQPNLIKSISWNVYSNNPYDFSVIFSKLNFIGSIQPEMILNGENYNLDNSQAIILDPNTTYSFESNNAYTSVEFIVNVITQRQIEQLTSIYFHGSELKLDGTILLESLESASFITFEFPDKIVLDEINSSLQDISYEENRVNFTYTQQSEIYFSAHFSKTENVDYILNEIAQGQLLKLEIYDHPIVGSLVLGPNNVTGGPLFNNSTIEFFIPSNWNRGTILIITWFKNGEFIYISRTLDLDPSKLISSTSITLNVGERSRIPILVQNLSSSEYKNADNIYSYYEGKLFSVDNQYGIVVNPGDFDVGRHLLLVNATSEGLASLQFDLEIIIKPFNPEIYYTINRNDVHSLNINFSIQEVLNWSVSSFLTISGVGMNETFEFWKPDFEIQLVNTNFPSDELELDLTISLENNLGVKHEIIYIPPFEIDDTNGNSGDETSLLIGLGLMGLTSGISFVGYRFVKSNFGTEKISF